MVNNMITKERAKEVIEEMIDCFKTDEWMEEDIEALELAAELINTEIQKEQMEKAVQKLFNISRSVQRRENIQNGKDVNEGL